MRFACSPDHSRSKMSSKMFPISLTDMMSCAEFSDFCNHRELYGGVAENKKNTFAENRCADVRAARM